MVTSYLIIGALIFVIVTDCLGDNYKKIGNKDKEIEELKKRIDKLENYLVYKDNTGEQLELLREICKN